MRQPRALEARFGRAALLGLAATEAGAAVREQGHGLLELLVAPVQLLHLGLVLRPHLAQLLQEMLVGADQGAGGEHRAAPEPLPRPARCLLLGTVLPHLARRGSQADTLLPPTGSLHLAVASRLGGARSDPSPEPPGRAQARTEERGTRWRAAAPPQPRLFLRKPSVCKASKTAF